MDEKTTEIIARHFYEVYASEGWSEPIAWDDLSDDLRGVWIRTAGRLVREASEQREGWTRAYITAETERMRAPLDGDVRIQAGAGRLQQFVAGRDLRSDAAVTAADGLPRK